MKTSTKLALAFLALAGAGGTLPLPPTTSRRHGPAAAQMMRFDRLDDGFRAATITFEEFSAR